MVGIVGVNADGEDKERLWLEFWVFNNSLSYHVGRADPSSGCGTPRYLFLESKPAFSREGISQLKALWATKSRGDLRQIVLHTWHQRSTRRRDSVSLSNALTIVTRKLKSCPVFNKPHLTRTEFEGQGSSRGKTNPVTTAQPPNNHYSVPPCAFRHTPHLDFGHTPFPHVHFHEKLDIFGPPTLIAEYTAEN